VSIDVTSDLLRVTALLEVSGPPCPRHGGVRKLSYLDFACFTLSDGRFRKGERRAWNGGNLRAKPIVILVRPPDGLR
jgi:hypothetical protein